MKLSCFPRSALGVLAFVAITLPTATAQSAKQEGALAVILAYGGHWQVTKKNAAAGSKPEELVNQCTHFGNYTACQQTVNGAVSQLLVFVAAGSGGGKYYTQSVMPDGRAGGRGELSIDGSTWTFSSRWDQGGKTTYYRTVNTFSGKNRMHFEQQESSNNKDWNTTNSGDETRAGTR